MHASIFDRGTSLTRNSPPLEDHQRALDINLLLGAGVGLKSCTHE